MDSAKIAKVVSYALSVCAPAVFGWVVGYFVGQSDSKAVILAAVLPVALSGIGMVFVFNSAAGREHDVRIMISLFMILFSASLYWGATIGKYDKGVAENSNFGQALEARFNYLQDCSVAELKINSFRKNLALQPLENSVFCR